MRGARLLGAALLAAAASLLPARTRGNDEPACTFCDELDSPGPGDGCYACDYGPGTADDCGPGACPDDCADHCPDGREDMCATLQASPSVFIANLTDMTVGINQTDTPLAVDSISAVDNTIRLAIPDLEIKPLLEIRLEDADGQTCEAAPKGEPLAVAQVYGALQRDLTFTTNLTAGDPDAADNCVVVKETASCPDAWIRSDVIPAPHCYLHFEVAETLSGAAPDGPMAPLKLKRCPLVEMPEVSEQCRQNGTGCRQYVFGLSGLCSWRGGDFVGLSEVPERFLPMLRGEEACPGPRELGGSRAAVIMVIVVIPVSGIVRSISIQRQGCFPLESSQSLIRGVSCAGAVGSAAEALPEALRQDGGGGGRAARARGKEDALSCVSKLRFVTPGLPSLVVAPHQEGGGARSGRA